MGMGTYGYWTESPAEKKARLKAAKDEANREREEAERWAEQGYVDIRPVRTDGTKAMIAAYDDAGELIGCDHVTLRTVVDGLEEVISSLDDTWTEKDKKRLDKAIVLIKVGAKYIAKVLKRRGYTKQRYNAANPSPSGQPYIEANLCLETSPSLEAIPASA